MFVSLNSIHASMVQVVDTTGAGDCFTGAVAVGILEGMSYQQAMKFAGLQLRPGTCSP